MYILDINLIKFKELIFIFKPNLKDNITQKQAIGRFLLLIMEAQDLLPDNQERRNLVLLDNKLTLYS